MATKNKSTKPVAKSTPATPEDVRTWREGNETADAFGLPQAPARGRFPQSLVKAFEANTGRTFAGHEGQPKSEVTVSLLDKDGQPTTVTVPASEVRTAAVNAGLAQPGKGRLPKGIGTHPAIVTAFAKSHGLKAPRSAELAMEAEAARKAEQAQG